MGCESEERAGVTGVNESAYLHPPSGAMYTCRSEILECCWLSSEQRSLSLATGREFADISSLVQSYEIRGQMFESAVEIIKHFLLLRQGYVALLQNVLYNQQYLDPKKSRIFFCWCLLLV